MMRSQSSGHALDKKFQNENNQTISHLFKQNKGYLSIKFIHPINFVKEKSYKQIRSIVFDVSI
jgi:hypothetical protein